MSTFATVRIELEFPLAAPRHRVWEAMTGEVDSWWSFRVGADLPRLTLEPWPGGRLYEGAGNSDGFLWGTIVQVKAGELLRLHSFGTVKPGVMDVLILTLADADDGSTVLRLRNDLSGDVDESMRACTADGWAELVGRNLRTWVETGVATPRMAC